MARPPIAILGFLGLTLLVWALGGAVRHRRAAKRYARLLGYNSSFEPVVDELVDRPLRRPVCEQQPACVGFARSRACLLDRQVDAVPALGLVERRLAEEDVGVACELRQGRCRAGVRRVREHRAAVLDAKAPGRLGAVGDPQRRHAMRGRRERHAVRVLEDVERLRESLRGHEPGDPREAAGRDVEVGAVRAGRRTHHVPPEPRDEVAAVVEVEVRDQRSRRCAASRRRSRRRASTPGPQSTSRRPPPLSTR